MQQVLHSFSLVCAADVCSMAMAVQLLVLGNIISLVAMKKLLLVIIFLLCRYCCTFMLATMLAYTSDFYTWSMTSTQQRRLLLVICFLLCKQSFTFMMVILV